MFARDDSNELVCFTRIDTSNHVGLELNQDAGGMTDFERNNTYRCSFIIVIITITIIIVVIVIIIILVKFQ